MESQGDLIIATLSNTASRIYILRFEQLFSVSSFDKAYDHHLCAYD
jgi:hypothetical protein